MCSMSVIGDRLKRAREQAGFQEATEAARAYGWPVPTYLSHENGTRGVPLKKLALYASAFKVAVEWLITGRGEPPGDIAYPPPPPANVGRVGEAPAIGEWPRDLPVYGTALGGNEAFGAFEFNTGDVVDYIRRPPRLQGVKNAFAVFAVGESML